MFESLLSLQFGGFYGGNIGDVLSSWEQAGVFSYLLPFLLIFAVVFGIMMKIKVFGENKGLNAVIALVIGLMALQFGLVPLFFSELFPRVGIALSVILTLLVVGGLFIDPDNKAVNYGLMAIGLVIFLVVLAKTSGSLGWSSLDWWYANRSSILWIGGALVVIAIIIGSTGQAKTLPDLKINMNR